MPELPEVETIRRGLKNIVGRKIVKIFRSEKKLRLEPSLDFQALKGAKISASSDWLCLRAQCNYQSSSRSVRVNRVLL